MVAHFESLSIPPETHQSTQNAPSTSSPPLPKTQTLPPQQPPQPLRHSLSIFIRLLRRLALVQRIQLPEQPCLLQRSRKG